MTVEEPNARHADSSVVCDQTPEQPWAPERRKSSLRTVRGSFRKRRTEKWRKWAGVWERGGKLHLC